MQFGCAVQGLLLKEGRIQLFGRTGEQISQAGFRDAAGFLGSGAAFQTNLLWGIRKGLSNIQD